MKSGKVFKLFEHYSKIIWPLLHVFFAATMVLLYSERYPGQSALMFDATGYFNDAHALYQGQAPQHIADPAYSTLLAVWFRFTSWITPPSIKVAQLLNALLWGLTCALSGIILKTAHGSERSSRYVPFVLALSPAMISFYPKIYSEPLACFALLTASFGILLIYQTPTLSMRRKIMGTAFLSVGLGLLCLTKSAYAPALVLILAFLLLTKRFISAVAVAIVLLLIVPTQGRVQSSGRGQLQVAVLSVKLERWPAQLIAKCSLYNLSQSLGEYLLPEVRGACSLNGAGNIGAPLLEMNYEPAAFDLIRQGFSYGDGVRSILQHPFKYLLLLGMASPGMFWIEGFQPESLHGTESWLRMGAYLLRVLLSTALWVGLLGYVLRSIYFRKSGPDAKIRLRTSICVLAPVAYTASFYLNVPVEHRYFFPIIPLLYIGTALLLFPINAVTRSLNQR